MPIVPQALLPSKSQVKSYLELSFEAMRRRLERPYLVWLLARALDPQGSGYVSLKALRQFVAQERIATRQTLWRWIRAGDDVFWVRSRHQVHLKGLLKLTLGWDADLRRQPVYVAIEDLGSLARFRRALVATFFADKERIIAQAKLGEMIGRTPRSIRRYLQGISRQALIMVSNRRPPPFREPVHVDLAQEGYFRIRIDGRWMLAKRLPNAYFAPADMAPFGLVKRSHATSLLTQGATRCFFRKPKAAGRAIQGLQEGERVFVQEEGKTDFCGAQVWQGWSRTLGIIGVC